MTSARDAPVASQTPEPPPRQLGTQSRYMTPPTNLTASPAAMLQGTPVSRHTQPHIFDTNQMNSMSPPSLQVPVQRMATMPLAQHANFLSPSPPIQHHYSSPTSTEDVKPAAIPQDVWPAMQACDQTHTQGYRSTDSFLDQPWPWMSGGLPNTSISANLFEHDPNAAFLDLSQQPAGLDADTSFQEFWSDEQGVQQFPFHSLPDDQRRT
jgi:hypothetical protein